MEDLFTSQSFGASKVAEDSRCFDLRQLNRGIKTQESGRRGTCRFVLGSLSQ